MGSYEMGGIPISALAVNITAVADRHYPNHPFRL